jgi:flagellar basal-body rod modification protein FlgD
MVNSVTTNTASAMTAVSSKAAESSQTATQDLANLNQDTFMKLLLTQVKNQNPTNPMDTAQFMGQLAQLASVQGIQQLNQSVDQFSKYMEQNRALQAASLVGREAMVSADSITSGDGSIAGIVQLPPGAQNAEVGRKDAAGNLVDKIKIPGSQAGGNTPFSWSKGKPDQSYSLSATAMVDGAPVDAPTLLKSPVESVSFDRKNQQTLLHLKGAGAVPLTQVEQVF